jgi:hypothetical protein
MKRRILQSIANGIINEMSKTISDEKFNRLYELGMGYNDFCINVFDVYLD